MSALWPSAPISRVPVSRSGPPRGTRGLGLPQCHPESPHQPLWKLPNPPVFAEAHRFLPPVLPQRGASGSRGCAPVPGAGRGWGNGGELHAPRDWAPLGEGPSPLQQQDLSRRQGDPALLQELRAAPARPVLPAASGPCCFPSAGVAAEAGRCQHREVGGRRAPGRGREEAQPLPALLASQKPDSAPGGGVLPGSGAGWGRRAPSLVPTAQPGARVCWVLGRLPSVQCRHLKVLESVRVWKPV